MQLRTSLLIWMALCLCLCGFAAAQHRITLALDWTPNTNHTGIYAALAQGWYEEAGVELTVLPYGSMSPDTLVANGQADVGISGAESVFAAAAAGEPVVSIAAIMATNTAAFAVRADSDIMSPKDFAGKLYAAFGASYERPILEALIAADGSSGTVEEVFLDVYGFDALLSGRADIVWIFEGWQAMQASYEGIALRLFNFTEGGLPDYYTPVLIASPQGVAENREALQAFLLATHRGYEYAARNPDYALQMLIDETEPGTFPATDFLYDSQLFVSQHYMQEAMPWGIQQPSMWSEYGDFLLQAGVYKDAEGNSIQSLDYDQLYTNALLPGADTPVTLPIMPDTLDSTAPSNEEGTEGTDSSPVNDSY